jgi:hypothetical protein
VHLVFYCSSVGTTSGGVVTFEEAAPVLLNVDNAPVFGAATGGYSVITTTNASTFSADTQVAVHAPIAAYGFVRARVSTAITGGGSVNVGLVAT